jgi:hypothetical protein
VVDVAELLVALPGECNFVVRVPEGEFRVQPGSLFVGEVFGSDLQGLADPVEQIALAAPGARACLCWTLRRTSSTMAEPSFTFGKRPGR